MCGRSSWRDGHTLPALLEIKAQLDIITVIIRLYRNLTDQQCLHIGFNIRLYRNLTDQQCLHIGFNIRLYRNLTDQQCLSVYILASI